MSNQLIVAGFHRSGTSLACRLLQRAGLFLGYKLLGAAFSNPYGHFEDREVLDIHNQILKDNGLTWQVSEQFSPVITESHLQSMRTVIECRNREHELWGFKDPRVCLLMTLWKQMLPDAKFLVVYRHFADSTYSLGKRHSTELFLNQGPVHLHRRFWEVPDLGLRMWLVHNKALVAFAHAYPEDTLVVSMDMIQEGFPVVKAVNRRWDLGLDDVVQASQVFDPNATVRRSGKQPVSDRSLIGQVEETWQALEQLSRREKTAAGRDTQVVQ